jgi:hypothetical protein
MYLAVTVVCGVIALFLLGSFVGTPSSSSRGGFFVGFVVALFIAALGQAGFFWYRPIAVSDEGVEALAAEHLQRSTTLPRDVAAWASTRRQLGAILAEQGRDAALLAPLALPTAIHFAGHMIALPGKAGRFRAEQEDEVKARIAERLQHYDANFLCGSLACGADILFAEAALARKAELHLVLPFAKDDFGRLSVLPGGP